MEGRQREGPRWGKPGGRLALPPPKPQAVAARLLAAGRWGPLDGTRRGSLRRRVAQADGWPGFWKTDCVRARAARGGRTLAGAGGRRPTPDLLCGGLRPARGGSRGAGGLGGERHCDGREEKETVHVRCCASLSQEKTEHRALMLYSAADFLLLWEGFVCLNGAKEFG